MISRDTILKRLELKNELTHRIGSTYFKIKGKKYFGSTKGNGVQCIQKINGSVLGWFRPSPSGGITTDPNGKVIGFGNVLGSLVADLL
jgi:hypothetical protein